ncbi:MAG: hypothetical protein ABSG32_19415, partial [Terriglobia bacterium]
VTSVRTSRTRDRGPERRAETAVFGLLFLQGMYHYRVLAKYTVAIQASQFGQHHGHGAGL